MKKQITISWMVSLTLHSKIFLFPLIYLKMNKMSSEVFYLISPLHYRFQKSQSDLGQEGTEKNINFVDISSSAKVKMVDWRGCKTRY